MVKSGEPLTRDTPLGETIARRGETRRLLPIAEAASCLGMSPRRLERLAARHGNAFIARRGSRGRSRSTLIDIDALHAALEGAPAAGDAAAKRIAGTMMLRLLDQFADRLTADFYAGTFLSAPFHMKQPAAARCIEFIWHRVALELSLELTRAGIEHALPEPPEKIVSLRRF